MKEDIIIVGAGIIGMSLALSLSSINRKIVIIEKNLSNSLKINRVYSISKKTKSFYELLGIWNNIDEINNIDSMCIYYRNLNPKNMIIFSEKINKEKIGYIAQSKNISLSLLNLSEPLPSIAIIFFICAANSSCFFFSNCSLFRTVKVKILGHDCHYSIGIS